MTPGALQLFVTWFHPDPMPPEVIGSKGNEKVFLQPNDENSLTACNFPKNDIEETPKTFLFGKRSYFDLAVNECVTVS